MKVYQERLGVVLGDHDGKYWGINEMIDIAFITAFNDANDKYKLFVKSGRSLWVNRSVYNRVECGKCNTVLL